MMTSFFSRRVVSWCILLMSIVVVLGNIIFGEGQYYYVSTVFLIMLSWLLLYFRFERSKPSLRRIVILAVMITLIVSSRIVFILTPSFKPMSAMIILCGMVFGKEEGYLCGSVSAFISNFIFGQGPWTPFQMFAWGMIGYGAGFLKKEQTYTIYAYALWSGLFFTLCMDVWSVLLYETFQWQRYIAYVMTSVPITMIYCIANVVFIYMLKDTCISKFDRIKKKYRWEIKE